MRTTLSIDDDVLAAAKGMAARQHKTLGEVISTLVRRGLQPPSAGGPMRNGISLLPAREGAAPVTPDLVNRLRDELA